MVYTRSGKGYGDDAISSEREGYNVQDTDTDTDTHSDKYLQTSKMTTEIKFTNECVLSRMAEFKKNQELLLIQELRKNHNELWGTDVSDVQLLQRYNDSKADQLSRL